MNYLNRRMVALVAMPYMGEDLQPGDHFFATDTDAPYLQRCGRANNAAPPPPHPIVDSRAPARRVHRRLTVAAPEPEPEVIPAEPIPTDTATSTDAEVE